MTYKNKRILAVIPARGQSKGIAQKNLQHIHGKSLIRWAGEVLQSLPWLDKTLVSTDCPLITSEAQACGLDTPFVRPAELAADNSLSIDVLRHACRWLARHENTAYDIVLLIEPTSPFRRASDITQCVEKLIDQNYASIVTVSQHPASYAPEKTLLCDQQGALSFYHKKGEHFSLRQKIPAYFHRNGICYAITQQALQQQTDMIGPNTGSVVIRRRVVNIDEPFDLQLCHWLWSRENLEQRNIDVPIVDPA